MTLMSQNKVHESLKTMKIVGSFQHQPGTAVYGDGFCVHKDYMKPGILNQFGY